MTEKEFQEFTHGIRPQLTLLCRRFFKQTHLGIDAEDAVQETLVKLWKLQGKHQEYRNFQALAIAIAKNICIDYTRKKSNESIPIEKCQHLSSSTTPDQDLIGKDIQIQINKALSKLPPTQRKMLSLRSEGLSLDMIAIICNANKTSTKTMISAARKSIYHQLKGRL